MHCLHPITIRVDRSKPENAYLPSDVIEVPCGKCPACLTRRQNDWAIRILKEAEAYDDPALFCTLTYEDSFLPEGDDCFTLCKTDVQKWIHDLRQKLSRKFGENYRIAYFLCGEYGDKFARPHYHCVLFGFPSMVIADSERYLQDIWNKGFVTVDELTPERAKYVAKYVCKARKKDFVGCEPPFALMSKRPAIGSKYLEDKQSVIWHRKTNNFLLYDSQGTPYSMPRYFRNKIYSKSVQAEHSRCLADAASRLDFMKFTIEGASYFRNKKEESENYEKLFYKRIDEKLLR